MRFTITGDTLFLDGRPVATLDPSMNASLRDTVEKFLDGRPLSCDEQAYDLGFKEGVAWEQETNAAD